MSLLAAAALAQAPAPQGPDPAYEPLSRAYEALRAHDYDRAIDGFTQAIALSPKRTDIRKDLAYTLLKTGDSEAARLQFGEVMRLDPADSHSALEYAFLCYESIADGPARKAEARRIFERVRETGDAETRATATSVFRNLDEGLKASIARWKQALTTSAPSFSAHYELAQRAEEHDENDLAAEHYRAAFRLLTERKSVLLELARVETARGNIAGAMAALLAASRGGEPRAAELARDKMPDRYPYVYEFRAALELDPKSNGLHRELAYLLLSMSESGQTPRADAIQEFEAVVSAAPEDYLSVAQLGLLYLSEHRDDAAMPLLKKVLASGDAATANRVRLALHMPPVLEEKQSPEAALDPRVLGQRSYDAGFLKDALKYFEQARQIDPVDAGIPLKLGWTNNMLHHDAEAVRWFSIARRSADPKIAAEADRAWHSLHTTTERFRTTVWMFPLLSSRWSDAFGYGQIKTEIRAGKLPVRPYVSVRFTGDVRGSIGTTQPQSLSESAFTFGVGAATNTWHGWTGWAEIGEAQRYRNPPPGAPVTPGHWADKRGGVFYARTFGTSLAAKGSGWFYETTFDSVFVSHFGNDIVNPLQNKVGYTKGLGAFRTQAFWTSNITFDSQRQYWANFIENGPSVRIHPPNAPPSLSVTVSVLRGVFLVNDGNPRRPNYNDFRVGVWYALTK